MTLVRHVLVRHGQCVPWRPTGAARSWLRHLPETCDLRVIDRASIVLPRPGDGWYAPPERGDGFPWGQLTALGLREARALGRTLSPLLDRHRLLIRALNCAASVQTAQALASGLIQDSLEVLEVLVENGDDLMPSTAISNRFPWRGAGDSPAYAEEEAALRAAVDAVVVGFGIHDFDVRSRTLEELASDVECVVEAQDTLETVNAETIRSLGRFAFARVAAPLHADPACLGEVLGALAGDLLRSIDEAASVESQEERLLVVPGETMVSLVSALGLGSEFGAVASGKLGPWPGPGTVLELNASASSSGEVSLRVSFQGRSVGPDQIRW
eukprot:CAMPEP_0194540040 /NCGR_PEP_ID=MMETSP0253-20130528/80181_1 /TAXON_ID=2966 /ORGANISM="Noctiluca scintillans" /LENGTH=326 /DNA_ID=CAMNT_0039386377 /DNA_START=20 /DNA_END=997 /DNA_ORIENTATION=+